MAIDKIQFKRTSTAGRLPTASMLAEGELAMNMVDKKLYTKDHLGNIISVGGGGETFIRQVYELTSVKGQTTFNATYDVGLVDVLYNGVELAQSDYTATTGSTVVLKSAVASSEDVIKIRAYRGGEVENLNGETILYSTASDKTVKEAIDLKSDKSYVDTELAKKATVAAVNGAVRKTGDTMSGGLELVGSGSMSGDTTGRILFTNPAGATGENIDAYINKNEGVTGGNYVIKNKLAGTTDLSGGATVGSSPVAHRDNLFSTECNTTIPHDTDAHEFFKTCHGGVYRAGSALSNKPPGWGHGEFVVLDHGDGYRQIQAYSNAGNIHTLIIYPSGIARNWTWVGGSGVGEFTKRVTLNGGRPDAWTTLCTCTEITNAVRGVTDDSAMMAAVRLTINDSDVSQYGTEIGFITPLYPHATNSADTHTITGVNIVSHATGGYTFTLRWKFNGRDRNLSPELQVLLNKPMPAATDIKISATKIM